MHSLLSGLGSATCRQWAAKSPWMLHLPPLGSLANKGIYWPIYKTYHLSFAHWYRRTMRQGIPSSGGAPSLSCSMWALLIKLTASPLLCLSSAVLMLFTILGLNTIVRRVLSSKYHHPIIRSQQFLQQQQRQQQHKMLKNTTKIIVSIIDNNDIFFSVICLIFHSCSSTSF